MDPSSSILIAFCLEAGFALLFYSALRGRPKTDDATGTLWFRHSVLFRGFARFSAFAVVVSIWAITVLQLKTRQDAVLLIYIAAFFGTLSGVLLWETSRFALGMSKAGLDCRSPWRASRFVRWSEVEEVSFRSISTGFVIHTKSGWRFHVPTLVEGISEFLQSCEQHLSPASLAKAKTGYAILGRPFPSFAGQKTPSSKPTAGPEEDLWDAAIDGPEAMVLRAAGKSSMNRGRTD